MTGLQLTARSDQRVGAIGQTRMGKTFLMEYLLGSQPRVIAVDSKHRIAWSGYHMTDNPVAATIEDRTIYRPPNGRPPRDWWEQAMRALNARGGGVIYIDELSYVTDSNRIDESLGNVFRLGAELNVGVWFSAQESTSIHNTTLRQSEELFLFYNQGASDREKLTRIVGDMGETTAYLKAYQFVVFVRGDTYDNSAIPVYQVDAHA